MAVTVIWVTPLGMEMHCSAPVNPNVVVTVVPVLATLPVGHTVARTAGTPTTAAPATANPAPTTLIIASREVVRRIWRRIINSSPQHRPGSTRIAA
jgi:hypothetical protein